MQPGLSGEIRLGCRGVSVGFCVSQVSNSHETARASWVKLSPVLWPAKGLAAGESWRAKCFPQCHLWWVFRGQAGTDGAHGRGGTSSWRFYKGLLTIGFTTGLNDLRGAGPVQTGGCGSGPLLLSKMPAGHTATVALNGVSGVPAPRSCAILTPQIKSTYRGDLNMGSLRALHPLHETQMHSAGSFLSGSFLPYKSGIAKLREL